MPLADRAEIKSMLIRIRKPIISIIEPLDLALILFSLFPRINYVKYILFLFSPVNTLSMKYTNERTTDDYGGNSNSDLCGHA
jgi:hypothetical protein